MFIIKLNITSGYISPSHEKIKSAPVLGVDPYLRLCTFIIITDDADALLFSEFHCAYGTPIVPLGLVEILATL